MSSLSMTQRFWHVIARGTLWSYLATYGSKAIVFISTIVLARLLLKEDFGVAGYAIVVISFLNVLHDFGIGTAIIYFDFSESRTNTAFWLNVAVGLLLFSVTWALGPLAGDYFRDQRAVEVTRALGLTFPLTALGNIQDALLRKEMSFNKKFIPDMLKAITKTIVAVGLALWGMSYWSLIIGQLCGVVIWVALLWIIVPWRPARVWSQSEMKALVGYGSGIALINFLAIILLNVDYLLVGRYFGAAALGLYTIAFRLPELIIQEFPNVVSHVLLPAFTKIKNDEKQITANMLMILRYSAIVTVPVGLGLVLIAEPLILTLFSQKWIEAVPIMRAIAIQMTVLSLSFNIGAIYKAQAKNHILIKIILVRILILIPALWWAVQGPGTLISVAWVHAAAAIVVVGLDLLVAARMLQVPISSMWHAFLPAVTCGTVMLLAGLGLIEVLHNSSPILKLAVLILGSATIYMSTLFWFEKDAFIFINNRLRASFLKA